LQRTCTAAIAPSSALAQLIAKMALQAKSEF